MHGLPAAARRGVAVDAHGGAVAGRGGAGQRVVGQHADR